MKIGAEASQHDKKVFDLVKDHKERLRTTISELVLQIDHGHQQPLSNDLLTDTIFLLLEGGLATGAVYRSSEPLQHAKEIVATLI